MLAIELMYATPAAAAAPLRNAVGIDQNTGSTEKAPNDAIHSDNNRKYGLGVKAVRVRPTAVIRNVTAVWLRRSSNRSDRRPYQIIPTAPTANGIAETRPVSILLN